MTPEDERQESEAGEPQKDTYVYGETGIEERRGAIPSWLIAVAVGLIAWAIYYAVTYWSPPP
ncbi:MAG: hypothetical protein AB1710_01355 [Pseudomonadota bacterium]